jgi:hypothetical protein
VPIAPALHVPVRGTAVLVSVSSVSSINGGSFS